MMTQDEFWMFVCATKHCKSIGFQNWIIPTDNEWIFEDIKK